MGLRINESWKVLVGTLGLSLVGCGGAGLEGEDGAEKSGQQQLVGPVTLTLNGSAAPTLECGVDTWTDPGATAKDGNGAALPVESYNSGSDDYGPGPDTSAEGSYSIYYQAHDADWNMASATRTVTVKDRIAPTITLTGPATVTIQCYAHFEDPRATATDICYEEPQIVVTGEVRNWEAGTYTLTYKAVDSAGNTSAGVTRTVNVVNCPVW